MILLLLVAVAASRADTDVPEGLAEEDREPPLKFTAHAWEGRRRWHKDHIRHTRGKGAI